MTVEETVKAYVNAWNQQGEDNIMAALKECWYVHGIYTDPNLKLIDGIIAMKNLIHKSYEVVPVRSFHVLSKVEYHHGGGRYSWIAIKPGIPVQEGMDFFEFNADNKITRIFSFFEIN